MGQIAIKLAARTNVGLVRTNNEDNFQVAQDLTQSEMVWTNDAVISLGEKGALLVVCDGMGGMNAGEVASEIAIGVVREHFAPENISDSVLGSPSNIRSFMENAIRKADAAIKADAQGNDEHKGMGTTSVMAWVVNGYVYVAWCGDSRAYIYNPSYGLRRLTKDHSYVQSLVDKGKITDDEAFDSPDSNIITRSLCANGPDAEPESIKEAVKLRKGDLIMLCSDGLCGMIRDGEIKSIIENSLGNMDECVGALINGALNASGADNVTVAVCQVIDAEDGVAPEPTSAHESEAQPSIIEERPTEKWYGNIWAVAGLCLALLAVGVGAGYFLTKTDIDMELFRKEMLGKIENVNISNDSLVCLKKQIEECTKGDTSEIRKTVESLMTSNINKDEQGKEDSAIAEFRKEMLEQISGLSDEDLKNDLQNKIAGCTKDDTAKIRIEIEQLKDTDKEQTGCNTTRTVNAQVDGKSKKTEINAPKPSSSTETSRREQVVSDSLDDEDAGNAFLFRKSKIEVLPNPSNQ